MENDNFPMVVIQPNFVLGRFRQQLQASAHGWRLQLRHIEAGDFWLAGKQRISTVPEFTLGDDRLSQDELIQFANTEMLLGAIRSLVDYLDTIIGMKRIRGSAIELDRDISGIDELDRYINDIIADQARTAGAETNLKNPKKIEEVGVRDPDLSVAILSLFDLRQALEHHKRVATKKDIALHFYRLRVHIDGGEEFLGHPMDMQKGQHLLVEFVKETRFFARGESVLLSEYDIETILQSLAIAIGPDILISAFPPQDSDAA